ncbi:MAG: hypothetical protein HYV26_08965, partial [Candidatus Hydrogenedentes bacterium]|nr:hypothetical protein [Candidatus Hydrogenedentota bacterium]
TTYNEVPILSLMVPTPVPVYLAMPDKLLIASNSLEGLQSIIDLQKQGGTSGLFAKLEPPLDAAAPRYSALLLNSRLVSEVLLPLSALTGGLGGADTTAQGVANNVKEVRMISGMDADWMVSKLEVFLNKPGAGAPAEAPAPAGAQ